MPLPVVDFEASELRSFVSLRDRCSSTAACCAVAPCFIDPVLGRKKVKHGETVKHAKIDDSRDCKLRGKGHMPKASSEGEGSFN